MIVTVTRKGRRGAKGALDSRYTVEFDALPGKVFGPWGFRETCQDLTVSALLSATEARALVFDAWDAGTAVRRVDAR